MTSGVIPHSERMIDPPSTIRVCPVIRAANADERKSTPLAMSLPTWCEQWVLLIDGVVPFGLILVPGADVARGHGVDPDPVAPEFFGERLGE